MNDQPMNPDPAQERDLEILAWLEGSLSPAEAARFEREMESDPELAKEVEATRHGLTEAAWWMGEVPPGIERADALTIPKVVALRPRRARLAWWQAAAALALFAVGFAAGQKTNLEGRAATPEAKATAPTTSNAVQPAPTPERPTPAQANEEKTRQAAVQNVQSPTYIKDENGRLRVETTLAGSGTRAVWIVDGSFQVAQAAK